MKAFLYVYDEPSGDWVAWDGSGGGGGGGGDVNVTGGTLDQVTLVGTINTLSSITNPVPIASSSGNPVHVTVESGLLDNIINVTAVQSIVNPVSVTGAGTLTGVTLNSAGGNAVNVTGTLTAVTTVGTVTNPVTTREQSLATTGPNVYQDNRALTAANMGGGITSSSFAGGGTMAGRPGEWTAFSDPGTSAQATVTKAAVAARSHVITSISACVLAVVSQAGLTLQLRDGATVIGSWKFPIPPSGQGRDFVLSGLNIVIATNTAVTLEFTAAPTATNFESVVMTGYTLA